LAHHNLENPGFCITFQIT